jgi:hypothetical protein
MNRLSSLMTMAVAVAVVVLVSMPVLAQQQQQQPPAQPPAQAPAQAAKVFEGELTKVDATAKTLSAKATGGAEMTFSYTEQTQVVGPDKTVQGLAGKNGTPLKITYTDQGATHVASRIEMVEKK